MKRLALACTLLTGASLSAQTNTFPASGNVGISTTTPEAPLDVNGSIIARGLYSFIAKAPSGYWGFNHENFFAGRAGDVYSKGFSSQALGIFNGSTTAEDIFLYNRNNPTAGVLVLKASGNVGIGTANPQWNLDVIGSAMGIQSDNGNATNLTIKNTRPGGREWTLVSWGDQSGGGASLTGKFSVYDNTSGGHRFVIGTEGNVGIGTITPGGKLQISSADVGTTKSYSTANGFGLIFDQYYSGAPEVGAAWTRTADIVASTGDVSSSQIRFLTKPANANPAVALLIGSSGNVGIGTTNPQHKLAVNGTIKAKEVIVETTGWSDYVFADDYRLASLAEVEAHIKTNKHLPGIPSAAQVAETGVNVGDVQAALLAKVEELTLHLIAQEKNMLTLQKQNEVFLKQNEMLQARVSQLEAR